MDSELVDDKLSPEEEKYVYYRGHLGMPVKKAGALAGLKRPQATESNAAVKHRIEMIRNKVKTEFSITLERITEGILEAIDLARANGEPAFMIAGWRELGKFHGFDQPKKIELEVTMNGQVTVDVLRSLPDAKLLELLEADKSVIDADFYEKGK